MSAVSVYQAIVPLWCDHHSSVRHDKSEAGLTDDQRVSREGESVGEGARVKPGQADEQRTQ